MKVLIFCRDPQLAKTITKAVEFANHTVVDTVASTPRLVETIFRHTPHLCFAAQLPDDFSRDLPRVFPDLAIRSVGKDDDWEAALKEELEKPARPYTPRPYATGQRMIFHDEKLQALAKGKLHAPSVEPGWEAECQRQEALFLLQLHTARSNHAAAKRYLACMQEQEDDLDRELTYRVLHNSYKGLCWSRDLGARYCGLLAHYVHGVEIDYLPSPHPASSTGDYVHHELSLCGKYAVTVVAAGRPRRTNLDAIIQLAATSFNGESDDNLLDVSTQLYGMASVLRTLAESQCYLMDAWLDVDRGEPTDTLRRATRRAEGIYRDFWGFDYIIRHPSPLNPILEGFHAGTTRLAEYTIMAPSFGQVKSECRERASKNETPT